MLRHGIAKALGELETSAGSRGRAATTPTIPAWYDVTWNPTVGCSPVGPGCGNCSALRTVVALARMSGKGGARYAGLTTTARGGPQWTGDTLVRLDLLNWPLRQRRGRRILLGSLSDLFHENLSTDTLDAIHGVIAATPRHRFLVLTRRAERMHAYFSDPATVERVAARAAALVTPPPTAWPLPNLWLGVAVEHQQAADRLATLLYTPAARRWACFEPLIGPVQPDLVPDDGEGYVDALNGGRFRVDALGRRMALPGPPLRPLDWIMAGGETGSGARPTDLEWVRQVRDGAAAAHVPFFFKEWGEWAPVPVNGAGYRMVRCGRRSAGRLIDGRSWDELPAELRRFVRARP
jgi:protein gp37